LTWDRGLEMAKHKTVTVATDVKVYFCDPQQPLAAWHERKHQPAAATIKSIGLIPFIVSVRKMRMLGFLT